jgi:hypothetical protein
MSFYEIVSMIIFVIGSSISTVYVVLSLCYIMYKYSKGADFPNVLEIDNVTGKIQAYINPFYFKHPANYALCSAIIWGSTLMITIVWPIILPVYMVYVLLKRTRNKNLDKIKMWSTLQK